MNENTQLDGVKTGKKNRIEYLDIVKGIGIILVVLAHTRAPISKYIMQFHMPLFFMVSGYLYSNKKDVKTFVISKVKSLYLPFLACNILGTVVRGLLGLTNIRNVKNYIAIILTLKKDGVFFGATWFLGALFVISIAYRVIDYLLCDYKDRYILMTVFFGMLALCGYEHTFDYMLSRTMICSFFFAAGYLIKRANFPQLEMKKKFVAALISAALFLFLARGNSLNMGTNRYTYFASFILESFLGSYVILVISQFIDMTNMLKPVKKCLLCFGRNSLDIVIWQFVAFRAVIALQLYLAGEPLSTILDYYPVYDASGIWVLVYTIVGLVGSILIGQILKLLGRGVKSVIGLTKR